MYPVERGIGYGFHTAVVAGQRLGCYLAYEADSYGKKHTFKGHLAAFLDALQYLSYSLLVAGRGLQELFLAQFVQVGRIADEPLPIVVIYGFGAK